MKNKGLLLSTFSTFQTPLTILTNSALSHNEQTNKHGGGKTPPLKTEATVRIKEKNSSIAQCPPLISSCSLNVKLIRVSPFSGQGLVLGDALTFRISLLF